MFCLFIASAIGIGKGLFKESSTGLEIAGALVTILALFILLVVFFIAWYQEKTIYKIFIVGGLILLWGIYMIIVKTGDVFGEFILIPIIIMIVFPICIKIFHYFY